MQNAIYLNYINTLRKRLDSESDLISVILGPRQVGKTTSVLKLIEDHYPTAALYVSADDVFNPDAGWLREHWLTAQSEQKILFVDEIQKVHNWSGTLKGLFDQSKRQKQSIRCVLLGSSSLEIQRGLSESLTGRFQLLRAHHWNYTESKAGYGLDFEQFLKFGGYPGAYSLISSGEWVDYVRNSIISTVVEKDILQFNTVKNPALFRQAFDILISYPAQEISYTKLLGQLQDRGNVELIKYYISLYEGAYLVRALEKYSAKSYKRKGSSPKIVPLAPCLPYLEILAPYTTEDRGRIIELLVGAQLVRTGESLFYWREGAAEVDFVLQRGRSVWAIEVKSGRKKSRRGLEEFIKQYPNAHQVLITTENYADFELDPMAYLERVELSNSKS